MNNNPYARISQGIGETGTEALKDINKGFSSFGSNTYVSGTKEFLESNSMVAKLAFLLLVVIVFILLLRLGVSLLGWLLGPSSSPYLVKGMKSAKELRVISQDPNVKDAVPLLRSNNKSDGLEFTYSSWLFIEDLVYKSGSYRHVFHKGNDNIVTSGNNNGLIYPNNAPGLYISPNTNNLVVVMNSFTDVNEEIVVSDVPIKKWFNVIIRVENHNVDVYINGTLTARKTLAGVPKQNYGNMYVNMNGGFDGYLSNLRYWNKALNIGEIDKLVRKGPNRDMDSSAMKSYPPYLALRWFINN